MGAKLKIILQKYFYKRNYAIIFAAPKADVA